MVAMLRHWYFLSRAAVWLTLAFARAARYFDTRALRDLELPPESFTSKEKRRLQHYFYGTTYLGAVFCLLRGRPRTRREKRLFTNLAALAYYFDDLADAFGKQDDTGILWQDNPETYGHTADPSGRALHFLRNIYRELPPADLAEFRDFMHRVFNVETAGRQNGPHELPPEELARVTAEKGGCSVLMFRRALGNALSPAEREAAYRFGDFVQLCDDIFDLWHDRQASIATLATYFAERNDPEGLSRFFEDRVSAVKTAFYAAAPNKRLGGQAVAGIHFLVAITRVCLRHYADLKKKRGTLPLGDRAAMVVDMERWSNRLRAAKSLLLDTR